MDVVHTTMVMGAEYSQDISLSLIKIKQKGEG